MCWHVDSIHMIHLEEDVGELDVPDGPMDESWWPTEGLGPQQHPTPLPVESKSGSPYLSSTWPDPSSGVHLGINL